eukprot:893965-Pelagomonas_calceolata.AAC.7
MLGACRFVHRIKIASEVALGYATECTNPLNAVMQRLLLELYSALVQTQPPRHLMYGYMGDMHRANKPGAHAKACSAGACMVSCLHDQEIMLFCLSQAVPPG